MDIKTYLEKTGLSQEQFGKLVGVSQGLVWQWIEGRTGITLERVRQIVDATNGEITAHDLMPKTFPTGFVFPPDQTRRKRAAAS